MPAKRAVWSMRMSEWCEQASEQPSERPSALRVYASILFSSPWSGCGHICAFAPARWAGYTRIYGVTESGAEDKTSQTSRTWFGRRARAKPRRESALHYAQWDRTAKIWDESTGPLARPFTRSLAPLTSLNPSLVGKWIIDVPKWPHDLMLGVIHFHKSSGVSKRASEQTNECSRLREKANRAKWRMSMWCKQTSKQTRM